MNIFNINSKKRQIQNLVGLTFLIGGLMPSEVQAASRRPDPNPVIARLQGKSGQETTGKIVFKEVGDNVNVTGFVENLKPNSVHGFHIHETGDCSSPDGKSAGGHFSPRGHKHGGIDSSKRHVGDLGNITADSTGRAVVSLVMPKGSLERAGEGQMSIIQKAVVVHEGRDDLKSQPSGDAGRRIACGVIEVQGV